MIHVVLIVGHYAQHWQVLPVVTRHAGRLFLFADHRTPLAARQAALREHVALVDVEHMEVFHADTSPHGCNEGAHAWRPVESYGLVTAARCGRCPHVEIIEPVRGPLRIERVAR